MIWRREIIGTVPFLPHLKEGDFWHNKLMTNCSDES
jgi:hypothetical protein